MNIGMLWYDNDPKATLETKIQRAVDYYRKKYGAAPNLCFVNTKTEGEGPEGIEVRRTHQVLKNHLWLGKSEG
jgi:hypothetical protein